MAAKVLETTSVTKSRYTSDTNVVGKYNESPRSTYTERAPQLSRGPAVKLRDADLKGAVEQVCADVTVARRLSVSMLFT